jgi:hypothetical protein
MTCDRAVRMFGIFASSGDKLLWGQNMKRSKFRHLLACALFCAPTLAIGLLGSPQVARGDSFTIVAGSDANVTGNTVNLNPPGSYGLEMNAFDGTHAIVDVPLGYIPINATINSVKANFREIGYANTNGLVTISGYGRSGTIKASDGNSATTIATYNSIALGLGQHSVDLNSAAVSLASSLLGTASHLGLRFASGSNDTNSAIGSLEQSAFYTPPSVTVSYDLPNNPEFVPLSSANITGNAPNQYPTSSFGMLVNAFNSTKSILDYSLATLSPSATVASASISIDETSYANANGLVSIYAYSRSGPITGADATAAGTLIGSYNSVTLGVGIHSIALNAAGLSTVQSLLGSNQDLGLRFVAGSGDTNTQFGSLEASSAFQAPILSLTFAPKISGDVNIDGIVNGQDLALVSSNWLAVGPGNAADINRDNIVNGQDLALISSNWLRTSAGGSAAANAVPEPSGITLAAICFAGLIAGYVRRRQCA